MEMEEKKMGTTLTSIESFVKEPQRYTGFALTGEKIEIVTALGTTLTLQLKEKEGE